MWTPADLLNPIRSQRPSRVDPVGGDHPVKRNATAANGAVAQHVQAYPSADHEARSEQDDCKYHCGGPLHPADAYQRESHCAGKQHSVDPYVLAQRPRGKSPPVQRNRDGLIHRDHRDRPTPVPLERRSSPGLNSLGRIRAEATNSSIASASGAKDRAKLQSRFMVAKYSRAQKYCSSIVKMQAAHTIGTQSNRAWPRARNRATHVASRRVNPSASTIPSVDVTQ
jgi:hypothetical protein